MNLVGWLVAGGLAGWVVGLACDDDDAALLVNILVGSVGALIGATLAPLFRVGAQPAPPGFDRVTMLAAVCGALVMLGLLGCARWTLAMPRTRGEEGQTGADGGEAGSPSTPGTGSR